MIHFSNVTKSFGGKALYRGASFQANPGERIGLVGPNGAGKSTVFRILTGAEGVEEGTISMPSRITIGYFSQDVAEMSGHTALQEVLNGAGPISALAAEIAELEEKLGLSLSDEDMAATLARYGEARHEFEVAGGYEVETRAEAVLTGLGIPPADQHHSVETFSGGWKMRIALARILVQIPDVLLMDEPTNHLDVESIVWLEDWVRRFEGTLIMTSHDREFMNRVVSKIIEVNYGTMTVFSGNYDAYEKERNLRNEQQAAAHKRQQDMLAKEENFIARFAARASHASQVQSRVKKLEKIERVELPEEARAVRFNFPLPPRSGEDVVKIKAAGKEWPRPAAPDGRQAASANGVVRVFSGASAVVKRLDKVAVVGVNGAGKSTLLKMIAQETDPTEGDVDLGSSVEMGYFSQNSLDLLNPSKTVYEQVFESIPTATVGHVRALLGCFLFSGDDVHKKISVLSGGEKSRVVLAMILARPVNFLVLDEPTNHLDITSREVLLDALVNFEGTIVLVSHDRHFLKAVSNRVFKIDDHKMQIFEGGYAEFVESIQGDIRAR